MPKFCRYCAPLMRDLLEQKDQEIAAITEEFEQLKRKRTADHYEQSWVELLEVKELLLRMESRMQRETIDQSLTPTDTLRPQAVRTVSPVILRPATSARPKLPPSKLAKDNLMLADAPDEAPIVIEEGPPAEVATGWGTQPQSSEKDHPCDAVYLNGEQIRLLNCKTIGDVKIKVAARHNRFAPEVVISDVKTRKEVTDNDLPAPDTVLVHLQEVKYSNELWKRTLLTHARARDVRGIRTAMDFLGSDSLRASVGGSVLLKYLQVSQEVHPEIIEVLISKKVDPDYDDGFNAMSALALGASGGQLELARYLIGSSANVNKGDNYGQTALMQAALKGHIDVMHLLAVSRADTAMVDRQGHSALVFAATRCKIDATTALISLKSDVNQINNYSRTPLMEVAAYGYTSIVELLITHNADVNHADTIGQTVLSVACSKGYNDIACMVLESRCNVDAVHSNGWTPLVESAAHGREDICTTLIAAKAYVRHRDARKRTPLMRACQGSHIGVARLLVEARSVVNDADTSGRTALYEASVVDNEELVTLLRSAGALLPEELQEERKRRPYLT